MVCTALLASLITAEVHPMITPAAKLEARQVAAGPSNTIWIPNVLTSGEAITTSGSYWYWSWPGCSSTVGGCAFYTACSGLATNNAVVLVGQSTRTTWYVMLERRPSISLYLYELTSLARASLRHGVPATSYCLQRGSQKQQD